MLNSARMISQDRSRTEHDSFGDIEVPGGALWGAQTERARRNFQLSGTTLPADFIAALALIKAAAARANQKLGLIPADLADAIVNAALAVSRGTHDAPPGTGSLRQRNPSRGRVVGRWPNRSRNQRGTLAESASVIIACQAFATRSLGSQAVG